MRRLYVNLPVADLERSREFYAALGFAPRERFGATGTACMAIGDGVFLMLLPRDVFAAVSGRPAVSPHAATEVLLCLSSPSRAEADRMVAEAVRAGGSAPRAPQDYGFTYQHGFEDPDGHIWELMVTNEAAPPLHS